MTESEYIKATNRAKVTLALTILRDVLPGEEYGIGLDELSEIKHLLLEAEERLFSSYEVKEDDRGING